MTWPMTSPVGPWGKWYPLRFLIAIEGMFCSRHLTSGCRTWKRRLYAHGNIIAGVALFPCTCTMYIHVCTCTCRFTTSIVVNVLSEGRLTWHSGMIPPDEIKIGGDKGQGSMKTSFQICNVPYPNSCKNSVIFSIFEAGDTTTNLQIALHQFRGQIISLCGKPLWQYV